MDKGSYVDGKAGLHVRKSVADKLCIAQLEGEDWVFTVGSSAQKVLCRFALAGPNKVSTAQHQKLLKDGFHTISTQKKTCSGT